MNCRTVTRCVVGVVLFPLALASLGVMAWRARRDLLGAVRWFAEQDAPPS